jgi:hypothetical protein
VSTPTQTTHLLLVPLGVRDVLPDTLIPPDPILRLEDVDGLFRRHGEVEELVAEREERVEVSRGEAVASDVEEACGVSMTLNIRQDKGRIFSLRGWHG